MTTTRSFAYASYHDSHHLEIATPYNASFVNALKLVIPSEYRRWQPETKTWIIRARYHEKALRLLRLFFPSATVGEKPSARAAYGQGHECRCDADHRALYVCQNAPPEVVRAAYWALAKAHHPDAGGDHQRMQAINAAYARLTGEVRA